MERQGEVVSLQFHGVGVVLRFQLGPDKKGNQGCGVSFTSGEPVIQDRGGKAISLARRAMTFAGMNTARLGWAGIMSVRGRGTSLGLKNLLLLQVDFLWSYHTSPALTTAPSLPVPVRTRSATDFEIPDSKLDSPQLLHKRRFLVIIVPVVLPKLSSHYSCSSIRTRSSGLVRLLLSLFGQDGESRLRFVPV